MKKIIFLLTFLLPNIASAQYEISNIQGKWQEASRNQKKKNDIPFTDTMRIEIIASGYTMIRYQEGVTIIGEASIEKNKLKVKEESFEIVKAAENELQLAEKGIIHVFKRADEYSAAPIKKVIPTAQEGLKNIDYKTIKGKWTCYRKTDPTFDKGKAYIKQLEIKDSTKLNMLVEVAFHTMDTLYYSNMFMSTQNDTFILKDDSKQIELQVVMSDGEEMILRQDKITYYFKQFTKRD
jgi:hypothetical protein